MTRNLSLVICLLFVLFYNLGMTSQLEGLEIEVNMDGYI